MREEISLEGADTVGRLVDHYFVPLLCREIIFNLIYMYYIHIGENLEVFSTDEQRRRARASYALFINGG